jgi:microcystin-dependent protein
VIGITYGGGNGVDTFNLPDLRGEFIRGWDHGRGIDTGRTLGSAQTGSSVQISGGSPFYVGIANNTENSYSTGGGAGGWSSWSSASTSFGYVRPRNIALMGCIKY